MRNVKESVIPLEGERIATVALLLRNDRAWKADCHTPYGGLACRLGRCFCFAEVSTGHPHRNDRETDCRACFAYVQ